MASPNLCQLTLCWFIATLQHHLCLTCQIRYQVYTLRANRFLSRAFFSRHEVLQVRLLPDALRDQQRLRRAAGSAPIVEHRANPAHAR